MKKALVLTAAFIAATTAHAFDAESKYKQACAACHASGVANAPKAFDPAAWKPKLDTGMTTLVASVKNGKGAMPPRGLCNDCTDGQYEAIINYMAKAK